MPSLLLSCFRQIQTFFDTQEQLKRIGITLRALMLASILGNVLFLGYAIRKVYFKHVELPKIEREIEREEKERTKRERLKNPITFFLNRNLTLAAFPLDSLEIIFVGDSHIQNFELYELLQNTRVRNRGINSDVTKGVLLRLSDVTKRSPSKVFLEIGTNDILRGMPLDTIKQNYHNIITRIKKESPTTSIYLMNLLPHNWYLYDTKKRATPYIKEFNLFIKQESVREGTKYLDLYSHFQRTDTLNPIYDCGDKLHLNGKGYLKLREVIKEHI
jgi:lysophospholipase L1-like esterase